MEIKKTDTSGKPRLPQEEPMRDRMKQPLKTKVKYPGSKVKIPVSERKGRNTFKASFKEVLKGGKEHKKFLDKKRVNRSSGGPIEVRDIDGDGKKEGWEIGRAKGMAKGMGKKLKMRKKHNIGGRANLLEEMGRIDARKNPDAADRAEKRRVIGELNRGYKSGGAVLKGKKVGCQIK